jgi:CDP-diacylglycerol--glycerol-3-phosphate 3-phosphatidyltransferase
MVIWDHVKQGYLRLISPMADWMVARRVNPNHITTLGTLCSMTAGALFASGLISLAGWVLGLTAVFDVVDGEVARRSGRTTVFGAFYDSTLDRVADGALLGGLCIFFARNGVHHKFPTYMSTPMVAVLLLGIIGSFLTSYTRARAEGLGIDAKVGILQRPERVTLLAAPQAFFGLTLHGWVLVARERRQVAPKEIDRSAAFTPTHVADEVRDPVDAATRRQAESPQLDAAR